MKCTDLCMITFINDNQYSCLANWRLLQKIPSPSVALFTTFHQAWVRQLPWFSSSTFSGTEPLEIQWYSFPVA